MRIREILRSKDPDSGHIRPTIGYIAPDIHGASQIQWNGVLDAARKYDLNVICFPGSSLHIPLGFRSQSNILYELVSAHTVDGIISWASSLGNYTDRGELQAFHERYQPLLLVTIGRTLPGFPSLLMSSYDGMYEALTHLIEHHGYRRIAFIRGPEDHFYAQERFRAYTDALTAHGLSCLPQRITPPFSWETSMGVKAMQILLDDHHLQPQRDIEAVVAANDHMLLGALEVLQARGIRVPDEVALVGFDDIELGRTSTPPFTSVRVPYYEVGYQAVETLRALFEGQSVPDKVIIPSRLVVRRSCGCLDAIVTRAVLNDVAPSTQGFAAMLADRREPIVESMRQELNSPASGLDADWAESLLSAFLASFQESSFDLFLKTFDNILGPVIAVQGDVLVWQNVISAMQRELLPCFGPHDAAAVRQAENLWRQARVMIGEAAQLAQARREVHTRHWAETLRRIGTELITTFNVSALVEVLARELPQIGIPACYLALYDDCAEPDENHESYRYPQPAPDFLRLILAYNEAGRISLPQEGMCFPSRQLVPAECLPRQRRYSLVVEALYFREHHIGCAVFEIGPRNGNLYTALQAEISSALQGDLLVQQVQEHATEIGRQNAEISRQKHVLDTFIATVPDRICFKDHKGCITHANHAYASWIGVSNPAELLGKTEGAFLPEKDARRHAAEEDAMMHTGQPLVDVEEQQIWPDGRVSWSLTTKMPFRDEAGNIIGMFSVSRDITELKQTEQKLQTYRVHLEELVEDRTTDLTRSNERLHEEIIERRRAEDALRVSEQQYRMLAGHMMNGIVIIQEGTLTFANAAFATMVRHPLSYLVGVDPAILFPEDIRDAAVERLANPIPSVEARWQVELLTGDRQTIWVEIEQTTLLWDNQPALLLTVHNITHRKLRELQLEQERIRLQQENLTFKSMSPDRFRFGSLVGKSPAMQHIYELIVSAAASDVNVLIVGESGTGKELIARTLHQVSPRKTEAFVAVNCASIPETLFEREFFGHRKGAFTGAERDKPGLFDKAHQGVLFLDEVTELSPGTQAKLLRVLQDGEYTPLGSNVHKQANAAIIAATNIDCREAIAQGRLRKDFFYRIGVIEVDVPPLRERKDDLPLLIEHILEQYRQKQADMHGHIPDDLPTDQTMLPGELVLALYSYTWPGNVRELQNVLQRYLVTRDLASVLALIAAPVNIRALSEIPVEPDGIQLPAVLHDVERQIIADMLAQNFHRTSITARKLGIPLRTLQRKIKQYRLLPPPHTI